MPNHGLPRVRRVGRLIKQLVYITNSLKRSICVKYETFFSRQLDQNLSHLVTFVTRMLHLQHVRAVLFVPPAWLQLAL